MKVKEITPPIKMEISFPFVSRTKSEGNLVICGKLGLFYIQGPDAGRFTTYTDLAYHARDYWDRRVTNKVEIENV